LSVNISSLLTVTDDEIEIACFILSSVPSMMETDDWYSLLQKFKALRDKNLETQIKTEASDFYRQLRQWTGEDEKA
jgi:hypothetical protein